MRRSPRLAEGRLTQAADIADEIQLLALLPARGANERMTRQLGISVNTVSTRLGCPYRKPGVSGRREAIANARLRGLVE